MLKQLINDVKACGVKVDSERFMNVMDCIVNNGEYSNIKDNIYHIKDTDVTDVGCSIATVLRYGSLFNPVYVIVTDNNFNSLSEMTKRFIMLHEEGHIVNKHFCILGCRDISDECEADMYAARILGPSIAIMALEELKAYTGLYGLYEVNKRIKYIKKH